MEIGDKEKIKKNGYLSLFSEKNFILETFASIISRFGDGIDTIAFSLLVFQITGSTLLVATLFGINGIPNIIFGMTSGVVCKYITDKKIMAICDFGRFSCVGLIAVLFFSGDLAIWHLYVITFLNSSFEAFRAPAAMAIVPKIIPTEKLEHGIALSSSGCKISEIVGLAAAPLIIGLVGLGGAILVDAITFLICGVLIILLKIKDNVVSDAKLTVKSYFIDLKEGFSYIKKDSLILNIVIFVAVINALIVPLNSLQAPYISKVLNVGSGALSVISICILAGMTVATIFAPKIKNKIGNKKMFIIGGVVIGVAYTVMSLLGNLQKEFIYIALGINTFIFGIGILLINFPLQMIMLKKVPREFIPRVAATFNACALCAMPITAFSIGIISQVVTIQILFMIFGIATVIVFIIQNLSKITKLYDAY